MIIVSFENSNFSCESPGDEQKSL